MKIILSKNPTVFVIFISVLVLSTPRIALACEKTKITLESATKIALKNLPGVILESELDGQLTYEFEIRKADGSVFEIEINAYDASVISIEKD